MIKPESIDRVRDAAQVEKVVGHFVKLTKKLPFP
jgi:hypothetical protein